MGSFGDEFPHSNCKASNMAMGRIQNAVAERYFLDESQARRVLAQKEPNKGR
jgi:hypothetical protein